jgi:hypothetical protein
VRRVGKLLDRDYAIEDELPRDVEIEIYAKAERHGLLLVPAIPMPYWPSVLKCALCGTEPAGLRGAGNIVGQEAGRHVRSHVGLPSRRRKVSTEEFCRDFYDSQIFHAIIAGTDMSAAFWEYALESVKEADPSLAVDDPAAFRREMTALRVELFGLAGVHEVKRDEYLLREIVFTKSYLDDNKQSEIWDVMADYNGAIANSSFETAPEQPARMKNITILNDLRFWSAKKWYHAGVDVQCAGRVANRLGTELAWSVNITPPMLVETLVQRLGWQLNPEGCFRLAAVVFGLYNGARETIQAVRID